MEMFEKHARKGRLLYVSGKLQTRRWRKEGEDTDRFSTEILVAPGGRVQFLDKSSAAKAGASETAPAPAAAPEGGVDDGGPLDDDIPF